jgi:hypothetical protein
MVGLPRLGMSMWKIGDAGLVTIVRYFTAGD